VIDHPASLVSLNPPKRKKESVCDLVQPQCSISRELEKEKSEEKEKKVPPFSIAMSCL